MYSDMSKRISAWSLPNRKFGERARQLGLADAGRAQEDEAADRTRRVLEPGARRRIARDSAEIAFSWLMTRRAARLPCAGACRPRPRSPSERHAVHFDTTSSISAADRDRAEPG
jgi:hypothetical protein